MKNVSILDVPFSNQTMEQTIDLLNDVVSKPYNQMTYHVVTANPEIVMETRKNRFLKRILSQANLITADGIGVVLGSKWLGTPLPERVSGFDLLMNWLRKRETLQMKTKVYCIGAKKEIIEKSVRELSQQFSFVEIVGFHDGYFSADSDEEKKIVESIQQSKPDLLLVGLGAPRQEEFIYRYKTELQAKISIGVGGTFDVLSGTVKRAPILFQNLHLEWFWRLLTNPSRWKRQLALPVFVGAVWKEKIKKK